MTAATRSHCLTSRIAVQGESGMEIALDGIRQKYGPTKSAGAALIRKEINNGPSPSTTPGLKGAWVTQTPLSYKAP